MLDVLILFESDGEAIATRLAWAAAERGYAVWGDPAHFRGADDEEMVAAARAAKVTLLLWTPAMARVAKARESVFATIDPEKIAAARLADALDLPAAWTDKPADMLIGAEDDTPKLVGFLEKALRVAGAPARVGKGKAPVERMRALEEEAAAWRAIRDLGVIEGYDTYLKRFGDQGLFSELARSRREDAIASGQTATPSAPVRPRGGARGLWFILGGLLAGGATAAGMVVFAPEVDRLLGREAPAAEAPTKIVVAAAPAATESEVSKALDAAESDLAKTRAALVKREDDVVALELALDKARGDVEAAQALAAKAQGDAAAAAESAQVSAREAAKSSEGAAVKKVMQALADAQSDNASLRRDSAELRQELTAAKKRAAEMRTELDEAGKALAALQESGTRQAELEARAASLEGALQEAERRVAALEADKRAAEQASEERIAALEKEMRAATLAAERRVAALEAEKRAIQAAAETVETADVAAAPVGEEPLTTLPARMETHSPGAPEADGADDEPEATLFRPGGPAAKIPSPRPEL